MEGTKKKENSYYYYLSSETRKKEKEILKFRVKFIKQNLEFVQITECRTGPEGLAALAERCQGTPLVARPLTESKWQPNLVLKINTRYFVFIYIF